MSHVFKKYQFRNEPLFNRAKFYYVSLQNETVSTLRSREEMIRFEFFVLNFKVSSLMSPGIGFCKTKRDNDQKLH